MAEILGLGLSHYPGPLVPAQHWPKMIERNVEVGRVPAAVFAARDRWPAPMLAEWGSDDGVGAAREHERRLLAGYRRLQAELEAFNPDLVLIWGDDQFENYKRDCVPAFSIAIFDEVISRPYGGGKFSFNCPDNVWGFDPDHELKITGHRSAATALTRHLIEQGFDPAYSLEFRHPRGLAHSFNNTVLYLNMERPGITYPVIPFHVNCYGNDLLKTAAGFVGEGSDDLTPPAPTPARCFAIGAATARFFAASPWRVALVGSASFSHGSLTKKHDRLYPDGVADRARVDDLQTGRFARWGELSPDALDDAGQHEILNWICLAGAMAALGRPAEIVDYVETLVFNSSKCFAIFPPAAALTGGPA